MPSDLSYQQWEEDSVFPSLDDPFFPDHLARYYFAQNFIGPEARVLDVACGKGYGSAVLAKKAKTVLGIDLNQDSLVFARQYFGRPNIEFRSVDVHDSDQLGGTFDLVVAFEIIEHIDPPTTDRFLAALKRALRPGGIALISTPNHEIVKKSGVFVPPFHINNLSSRELKSCLRKHFSSVEILGQYRSRGTLHDICLHLDYWSLRHLLRARHHATPQGKVEPHRDHHKLWDGETTPHFLPQYRFSKLVAKQAGLSFAICRT